MGACSLLSGAMDLTGMSSTGGQKCSELEKYLGRLLLLEDGGRKGSCGGGSGRAQLPPFFPSSGPGM